MANDAPETKDVPILESFNHAVELKKSFNTAVSLSQTVSNPQTSDTGAVTVNTGQTSNESSNE